ncbi:hypothetical protein LshimejAT787_1800980 [Lyophyllum shimeji]|uniref:Uncharacterized protein n=1 Tax=Lyophyllum shimeji TaxID=47721 RepID=A0A9P3Q120_LYOSH|nr:hypothetical protein LshimejAT787_1800980 [Lyophyllum shimeji]
MSHACQQKKLCKILEMLALRPRSPQNTTSLQQHAQSSRLCSGNVSTRTHTNADYYTGRALEKMGISAAAVNGDTWTSELCTAFLRRPRCAWSTTHFTKSSPTPTS